MGAVNWSKSLRQLHRWVSIAFTLGVIANFVGMSMGKGADQVPWVGFLALFPLIVLLVTGLYLFVLPYTRRGKSVANE